jgi:hypothetical protein
MKQMKVSQTAILALTLVFGITMIACGGKAQAQTDGAAELKQAAGKAESAVKDAAGKAVSAVKGAAGSGKPAEATDFIYKLNKKRNGVAIIGIQKDAKFGAHLVVPAEIEGFPVVAYLVDSGDSIDITGHSDAAAKERNQPPLESVVLPDSITYTGGSGDIDVDKRYGFENEESYSNNGRFYSSCSFKGCDSLKSIVFPKNLKIAVSLRNLPSLKPEGITWPEALEVIQGFGNDSTTEVVIPNGVKIIMARSFSNMKKLTTVTIPDSIEEIRTFGVNGAFENCPELTTVNVSAHPIAYDSGNGNFGAAFAGCPKLGLAAQKAIKDTGYTGSFR